VNNDQPVTQEQFKDLLTVLSSLKTLIALTGALNFYENKSLEKQQEIKKDGSDIMSLIDSIVSKYILNME